jgi:lysozyme family protein
MELTNKLQQEYLEAWEKCQANLSFANDLALAVKKILSNKDRYETVAGETGVPWYVIEVINSMESDCDFKCHLHNGDSLEHRTVNEPLGRPSTGSPPFSWEYSATDALAYDGALGIKTWNLPTTFWFLEGFNGWGYRVGAGRETTPECRSPYIYSATNLYKAGKYVGDRKFDKDAVSQQVGCMALLRELERQGEITISTDKISDHEVGSVAAWQHLLNGCGYFPVLEINGHMDQFTIQRTKEFQFNVGLEATGDVDLETWRAAIAHKKLPTWSEIVPTIISRKSAYPRKNADSATARLHRFYSVEGNYQSVYDDVMEWRGTTYLSCVAFLSTALRFSGYEVPRILDDTGHQTWEWTQSLSNYLISQGWHKSENANELEPGDVVFTIATGTGDEAGVPDHVYMFSGWDDEDRENAWVIDNQKFLHLRNIDSYGDYMFTPFWYFLRK